MRAARGDQQGAMGLRQAAWTLHPTNLRKMARAREHKAEQLEPTTSSGMLASVFFDRTSVKGPGVDA